jgi:SAM-dependent methyltransferase
MRFWKRLGSLGLDKLLQQSPASAAPNQNSSAAGQAVAVATTPQGASDKGDPSRKVRRAQRDYYRLTSAANVLDVRVEALAQSIRPGATILDIGCNDGTIAAALIDRGVVKKVYGIDLENILTHDRPEIEFIEGDIRSIEIASLPQADGVLILNVLHHLIRSSRKRVQEILDQLLDRYEFVFLDLGSFSEQDDRGWRRAIGQHWNSDAEMWDALFQGAAWRFKILRYPTQGGGHRVLWKLYRRPYELKHYSITQVFVKKPGTWPDDKGLISIDDANSLEKPPPGRVIFEKIVSPQRDIFWVKRYLPPWRDGVASMEYEIWREVKKVMRDRKQKPKGGYAHFGVSELVESPEPNVVCAIYEPDLVEAAAVHFHDWVKFFDASDTHLLGSFGSRTIAVNGLRRVKILHICDFQASLAWDGIKLLDFEPNFWARNFLLPK